MAIVNRDLDVSQQGMQVNESLGAVVTAATYPVWVVPFPCQLIAAQQTVRGLSGAPNHSLWLTRFVAGAGGTQIAIGASMVAADWGVSGCQTYTITAAAASYPLQAGDLVALRTAAADTAAGTVAVTLVVRCLQDIKSYFGTV